MKFNRVLELLFPSDFSCVCCSREVFEGDKFMCNECYKKLTFLTGKLCEHCSEPIDIGNYCERCLNSEFVFEKVVSPFVYSGAIKSIIHGFKYSCKTYYSKFLSTYMAKTYRLFNFDCDFAIPVPLCKTRFKMRGYNQAELLAKDFCKRTKIKMNKDILIRVKQTPTQASLNFEERSKNMQGAFKVLNVDAVKDKNILIIDDVYTTGATLNEIAKTLKSAGANKIYAVTSAHTILNLIKTV